ncbi:hypothetical protein JHK87_001522 [Glycine soja]|nr:hypothetical protein JHK87_001522 [Glycine soja]
MAEHLASIFETEKDKMNWPFYFKIGVSRHNSTSMIETRHSSCALTSLATNLSFLEFPFGAYGKHAITKIFMEKSGRIGKL